MNYLVCWHGHYRETEDFDEVLHLLKVYTAYWCVNIDYEDDYITLYNECLENNNFGDIAQVYKIDAYYIYDNKKYPCGLYLAERQTPFIITKIF